MKSKEFIRNLMSYIKEHYQHPDAVFLKEELKFKQGKYVYGEISFNYSSSFEGVMSYYCAYNKEMGGFFAANLPPYQKPRDSYDMVFLQNSIQGAHYYQAPPLTGYPHGDAVKLPETEAEAEPIYADVLQHLQQYHIPIIRDIHEGSADTLKYLAAYPDAFRLKALTADYIVRRHNLTAKDKLVQDLFAFDDKVNVNENGLFSEYDLIFGNNDFDQAVKQCIMQAV